MGIIVRPARPVDAPAIARVQVTTWRTTYHGLVPDGYLDTMEEEPRAIQWHNVIYQDAGGADQPFVIVAEDARDGVVGFAAAGPERQADQHFRGELGAIYLLTEYHGRGIGRRVVGEIAQQLLRRGFTTMLVWVLSENPYRRFYEALGGRFLRIRSIAVGGRSLEEWAYGWDDIRQLVGETSA